jgi:acyl-CoA thioester hydrolase
MSMDDPVGLPAEQAASKPALPAQSGRPSGLPMNVSLVRVRMYHTDFVGGPFHGRFFDLFEEARTEAFRRAGFHWHMTHGEGIGFIVTHASCDFLRATAMDDELAIGVFVTRMTRVRCVVEYEVRRHGEDMLLARGRTDFAFWDLNRGRPAPVPPSIRDAVHRCEGMWRPARD